MALTCRHVELDGVGRGKRVLRPPGGQSSNIFGSEEPVMNGNTATSPVSNGDVSPVKTSPRKSLDDSQNRLFGTPDSTDSSSRSPANGTSPRKSVDSRNPITGLTKHEESSLDDHFKNGTNGVSNPLTGNGIGDQPKNTSVKMHNPPGGQSQVQFY